jgi:hypothetical protein
MPKLIDWGVRYELIREAVVRIAAREGAGGVSFVTVAAELRVSVSTLRRTLDSPNALPQMGTSLLARLRRQRRYMRGCPRGVERGSVEHVVWTLTSELPVTEEDLEQERAWVQLTGPGASEACTELRRGDEDYLDALMLGALKRLGTEESFRAQQTIALRALLDGLIAARCRETVTVDEALACLDTFLRGLPPEPADGIILVGA